MQCLLEPFPDEEENFTNLGDQSPDVEDNLNDDALDVDVTASDTIKNVDNVVIKFVTTINESTKEFNNEDISLESDVFDNNGTAKVTSAKSKNERKLKDTDIYL